MSTITSPTSYWPETSVIEVQSADNITFLLLRSARPVLQDDWDLTMGPRSCTACCWILTLMNYEGSCCVVRRVAWDWHWQRAQGVSTAYCLILTLTWFCSTSTLIDNTIKAISIITLSLNVHYFIVSVLNIVYPCQPWFCMTIS